MKRDRLELQDGFAGLIHWFNVFLKPARGGIHRAELAVGVYDDRAMPSPFPQNHPTNVADIASVGRSWRHWYHL